VLSLAFFQHLLQNGKSFCLFWVWKDLFCVFGKIFLIRKYFSLQEPIPQKECNLKKPNLWSLILNLIVDYVLKLISDYKHDLYWCYVPTMNLWLISTFLRLIFVFKIGSRYLRKAHSVTNATAKCFIDKLGQWFLTFFLLGGLLKL